MRACTYNPSTGTYAYYETSHKPGPTKHAEPGTIGVALQEALPRLPPGSRYLGAGPVARGSLMDLPQDSVGAGIGLALGLVGLIFLFRK